MIHWIPSQETHSDDMSERPHSRSPSNNSLSSQSSQVSAPSVRQMTSFPQLSMGPRTSNVSMFTGLSDQDAPTSPSRRDMNTSALSPGSINRVFPIRSAVSIDPNVTPMVRNESSDGYPGMTLGVEGTIAARRADSQSSRDIPGMSRGSPADAGKQPGRRKSTGFSSIDALTERDQRTPNGNIRTTHQLDNAALSSIMSDDAASTKSEARSSISGGVSLAERPDSVRRASEIGDAPLVTARFKHVVTDGGHAIITGRDGETLQRCEDEPIHIPGAIQSFGLLIALKEQNGKLNVHIASENSARIIGYAPAQLFKLDNFLDIFSEEQADNLLDHLDFIRDEDAADVVANGPEVFMLSIRPPHHRTRKLWCAMHLSRADKDMIICEFEVEDDHDNPLVACDEATPEPPEDTLGSEPTAEELAESTINASKPLRVLRSARKKRGEAAAMEVFNIMSQVQEQLANAPSLQVFLKVLIGVVKELSGFHRVMIYQFDQAWNGRVVAELVDPRATKDLYKGLNFPASDIPRQARDMYKVNKVRLLYDRDQETSRLVCRTLEDLETPLDLTHSYLRAMSPIHIKYLGNMAVRSSMSISINAFDQLWGLIACHSYGSKGMRVSFPIRKMCRLVGDTASRNIERLSYASRLQARKLINTTSSSQNPSGYIVASSEDLLKLFDADVGALSIRDETKVMGNSHGHLQEVLAMVEFLRMKKMNTVYSSMDIAMDFPDLRYSPGLKFLAGLLYVPLSTGGNDFIAFFRRGVLQEVKWAGNPYEKFVKEGTEGYLEPRKSFKTWSETIVGRCRDWSEEEIETASVLCLVYGKFIDVWRQKEAALQSSQLTRLLLANSAHEVRTPLNAIINYLEIALEGSLDQETRDNLAKSHSASKSLVYVINDLLDLTKTEEHKNLVKDESFDLRITLKDATEPFRGDARRKNIEYEVKIDPTLPQRVKGDHRKVRQVLSNLVANAVQHTVAGSVKVDVVRVEDQMTGERCEIEISVEDTGAGMSQNKVDALFQELEEVSFEEDQPADMWEDKPLIDNKNSQTTLGLGLAIVARTVRHMNGQLRLKTEPGKGSRFLILLGFDLDLLTSSSSAAMTPGTPALPSPQSQRPSEGQGAEVTLVKRVPAPSQRPSSTTMVRKESADSMNSLTSFMSGKSGNSTHSNRSDADRLIDAIQEPLRLTGSTEDGQRSGGSGAGIRSRSADDITSPSKHRAPNKSRTVGSSKDFKSAMHRIPGQEKVMDSGTPIKPVRLPEEGMERERDRPRMGPKVGFAEPELTRDRPNEQAATGPELGEHFSVLVAEDDPINSKIMKKRLEKLGHTAYMTVNGEECSSIHGEQPLSFDAVLMDLQMPIVDGFSSTKMIRSFEKTQSNACLSRRATRNGRIPIFAVSASLVEREREKYIETGFDGWLLKPVDFKRVDQLLKGIIDDQIRNECMYQSGHWEQGGWFNQRQAGKNMYDVDTLPSQQRPTLQSERDKADGRVSDPASDGTLTPTQSNQTT